MNDTVVAIVSTFFLIGIAVGIIIVVAVSVLRAERRGDPGRPPGREPHAPGEQPSGRRRDDAGPDEHPDWPGGADSYFSDR